MSDLDRRAFLAGTAAATTSAAVLASPVSALVKGKLAAAADPRFTGKRHVAILGGGCGGLSAAHELLDRGFTVDVYELSSVAGGKCRSIPVEGTGSGGRADLPGEHGFRFFPGYYRHIIDTMARIPYGSNPNGVKDNLAVGEQVRFARKDAPDLVFPFRKLNTATPGDIAAAIASYFGIIPGLPANELNYFVTRLLEFLTSSDARREGQYDKKTWWDFVRADRFGPVYQNFVAKALTRNQVAADARQASTRTIGLQAVRILVNNIILSMYDDASRLLDGPTTEAWIDPWMTHLNGKGMHWFPNTAVEALLVQDGIISGARVNEGGRSRTVTADIYVLAVPVERARGVLGPAVRALDPSLKGVDDLVADYMTGVQFFLRRQVNISRGHISYFDTPWALTSISQAQFWNRDMSTYGNGQVRDIISVDVSNWDEPGVVFGKPAKQCTKEQIFTEVWTQMKTSLDEDLIFLLDSDVVARHLDPAIKFGPNGTPVDNTEPLLVNTVDSWRIRPTATTQVPNLFLASDYVKTNTDLASMEAANEAARRATNGILDLVGWSGNRAGVWTIEESPLFTLDKLEDQFRYSIGLPHKYADPTS